MPAISPVAGAETRPRGCRASSRPDLFQLLEGISDSRRRRAQRLLLQMPKPKQSLLDDEEDVDLSGKLKVNKEYAARFQVPPAYAWEGQG